jgi:hypothetical protein
MVNALHPYSLGQFGRFAEGDVVVRIGCPEMRNMARGMGVARVILTVVDRPCQRWSGKRAKYVWNVSAVHPRFSLNLKVIRSCGLNRKRKK